MALRQIQEAIPSLNLLPRYAIHVACDAAVTCLNVYRRHLRAITRHYNYFNIYLTTKRKLCRPI